MCSKLEVYAPSKMEKKYPSTPHFPFSPCSLDKDDVVSNHVSNFIGTDQVVVLEKLDGANCCITHNGEVFARTHSKVTNLPWFSTIKSMVKSFDTRVMDMLREKNLVLFGENMTAIHSITYDGLRSYFYLFGVLNRRRGMWLSWSKVTHIAKLLGIPTVPLVCGPKSFTSLDELKTLLQREASQASRPPVLTLIKGLKDSWFVIQTLFQQNNFRNTLRNTFARKTYKHQHPGMRLKHNGRRVNYFMTS